MFAIELFTKNNPIPMTVERNEKEGAQSLYSLIIAAISSGEPKVLELTCEKQTEKNLAVLSEQICAVQMSEKNSSASVTGVGFGRY